MDGRVADGSLLVMAPDPVVCFAGARYRQVQRFDVHERGALVVIDVLTAGRSASGERWAFEEYVSALHVRVGGRRVVHDALALRQADGSVARRLRRFDALAVVLVLGDALHAVAASLIADAQARPVARRADLLIMATALGTDGCLLRLAGTSGEQVTATLRHLLRALPARLGDDPWTRKW